MEQLILLIQKRQLIKEERLKSLIKLIDKRIIKRQTNLKHFAFFKLKHSNSQHTIVNFPTEHEPTHKNHEQQVDTKIRDALHQMQNYNLVQIEIIKKEKLSLMVNIFQETICKQMSYSFFSMCRPKLRLYQLRILAYKLHRQQRFVKILNLFNLNRMQLMNRQFRKNEAMSFILQRIKIRKQCNFYEWYNLVRSEFIQGEKQYKYEQLLTQKKDHIQIVTNLYIILQRFQFKRLSQSFSSLQKCKKQDYTLLVLMIHKILMRKKRIFQFQFYDRLLSSHNCGTHNMIKDLIRNVQVVSGKLTSTLSVQKYKQLKKKRNLMLFKFLNGQQKNERMNLNRCFTKWQSLLSQYNLRGRLKMISQNYKLEDDQKLLIQQYKQIQNENSDLQALFQQVQTYYNTPTGQSVRKQIEEDDYTDQFVENIENQNMELKQKILIQEVSREQYTLNFQNRKQELLAKLHIQTNQ